MGDKRRLDWTLGTLHHHLTQRIKDLHEELVLRDRTVHDTLRSAIDAQQAAVGKAEIATDKRFESVNEFRAQLGDQAATFITRAEYEAQHRALIDKLDTSNAAFSERLAGFQLQVTSRLDLGAGSRAGWAHSWTVFIAGSAVLTSIIAVLVTMLVFRH